MTRLLHLLGAGRAGTAVARLLAARGFKLGSVCCRSETSAQEACGLLGDGTPTTDALTCFTPGGLSLLALPERSVAPTAATCAARLSDCPGAVALHLSGALSAEVLAPLRSREVAVGSCHPLAVFAKREQPRSSLAGVTWDIDGDPAARDAARALVTVLGGNAIELAGDGKAIFHAAACTAANALVALFDVAQRLAQRGGATAEQARAALVALSRSTLDSLERGDAPAALTGPIERGEPAVIATQIAAIARSAPELLAGYRTFARATLETARRKHGRDTSADAAIARLLEP